MPQGIPPHRGCQDGPVPDQSRERHALEGFIEVAGTLTTDFDLIEMLDLLSWRCAESLGAAEVSLLLAHPRDGVRQVAASSEHMRALGTFEIQNSEGPCTEVLRSGRAILNESVATDRRWPNYASLARAAGYQAVYALPMRHEDDVIGVILTLHTSPLAVDDTGARLAQAYADMAAFALRGARDLQKASNLAEQLQEALRSRIVIEQAKGVLSERLHIDTTEAFALLRSYSRNTNSRINEVAAGVVEHRLGGEEFTAGSQPKGRRIPPPPPAWEVTMDGPVNPRSAGET